MASHANELRYAVRLRVLLKYFGQLCLVLAALTLVPFAVSWSLGDTTAGLRLGITVGGLAVLGVGLARLRAPSGVQTNEGMVLLAMIFLFTPLAMAYPMMGSGLGFVDAFFEAVSGVTTTGLSTKASLVDASPAFLFARAWMQWYGGLGIVVLSLALVVQPGLVAKGLAVTEAEADDLVGGTRAHARRGLKVYSALTAIGILGSLLAGLGLFDAIVHTLAAVSTGGFGAYDDSLRRFGVPAQMWIILLCLAGAVPLTFHHRLVTTPRRLGLDLFQFRSVVIAALLVTVAVGACMRWRAAMDWSTVAHHAPLLAFSAQTTAGFSSISCAQLDAGSKLILIFSMLAGGGLGSTAGGFKLLRLLMAVSVLRLILLRTCLPKHAVVEPQLAGRRLEDQEIRMALTVIVLFVVVVSISWLAFVTMGYAPLDSLFEVASATGTVGLSVGVTSESLPTLLKGVLCADMLMGRLEIVAWLVMLYPGTWIGRRMEAA